MNKYLIALTSGLLMTAVSAAPVYAAGSYGGYGSNCTPSYGSTECPTSLKFSINKKVAKPGSTDQFVENLGFNDDKFGLNNVVTFQLTFTNNGDATLSKVVLKDVLPAEVTYVAGGSYNANDRTVTFEEKDVKAGENRTVTVSTKVTSASDDKSVVCTVNKGVADVDGKQAIDNAQFCIQTATTTKGGKTVFPAPSVTATPATGAEAFSLLALMPTGALGYFLRKKTASH